MRRYGHLFERIATFSNLLLAAKKALRGKKDKKVAAEFFFHLETELLRLEEELKTGAYIPRPYRSVKGYLRYMDDLLLFGDDKAELRRRREQVDAFLRDHLKLELKEESTVLAPVSQGIPFLGFRVFPGLIRLQRAGWTRFRREVREREEDYEDGKLDERGLVQSVQSLLGHLQHATPATTSGGSLDGALPGGVVGELETRQYRGTDRQNLTPATQIIRDKPWNICW